ncbi:MAG: hypothetical protein OEW08_11675 [Gammaproteobacteria bacterium]|nr:hypothetical protein [Gammaproteobacteria bacterium]
MLNKRMTVVLGFLVAAMLSFSANAANPVLVELAAQMQKLANILAEQQAVIANLQSDNKLLTEKLRCVSSLSGETDFIFEGCNVHVRNGMGRTPTTNQYGNLIIGYNKNEVATRKGSHNIVVGDLHEYTSYGGIVSGNNNALSGPNATILSSIESAANNLSGAIIGANKGVTDTVAVILGGTRGYAGVGGNFGVVIGGMENSVTGWEGVSVGGALNSASGNGSLVCGGSENNAVGSHSTACGGSSNVSKGIVSSINGGSHNTATGRASSVSGGWSNSADGDYSSVLGGNANVVSTMYGTSP